RAAVEYQVNEGKSAFEPVALQGENTREAKATHLLVLAGKVKPEDSVRYRIVAWDNRDVPGAEPPLGPQQAVYPPHRWLTLKVVGSARPLGEQEILAQRDDVQRRLEKIRRDLEAEKRRAYKVQQEARDDSRLSQEHRESLDQLRPDSRGSQRGLTGLARDTALATALQAVTEKALEVAEGELKRTDQALARAGDPKAAAPKRFGELNKADTELASAIKKLEELQKENQKLAQQRLDQLKL